MLAHHYNQPRAGCRSPVQDVEHAVLCCAAPWQWYPLRHHLSSADQAACTSGADLLPRLSSPQVQCPGDVCLFALDTEKLSGRQLLLLLSQAEGKPSLPQVCLSKVVVSPFMKAQGPLCLSGMREPISLKTFLGEGFRVASCSPGELLAEGGV